MTKRSQRVLWLCLVAAVCLCGVLASSAQKSSEEPKPSSGTSSQSDHQEFYLHAFHAKELGLDCSTCHVPEKPGSVSLQRPGHDQCMTCHEEAFSNNLNQKICSQCHSVFPPTSSDDLLPFPRFKEQTPLLIEFSHAKHVDPEAREDARSGFRADCTFCHHFDAQSVYGTFPRHAECASCHSKPGMKPMLKANSTTPDCRGCHAPEQIENPGKTRPMIAPHGASGKYADLRFSHGAHLKFRKQYQLSCTTCHSNIAGSNSLADLTLPTMISCVACHEMAKTIPAQFRMSNCHTCHVDKKSGVMPPSHTRYIKPAFHTESFREHHEAEASAADAKCFVCHTNVQPASGSKPQCLSCHQVMMPASHTARWRDDVHGKYAAMDRYECAICHQADFCSRCHNELPRSHVPVAQFKNGGHAMLAKLNERSCFTCHTFQDTCAKCHAR